MSASLEVVKSLEERFIVESLACELFNISRLPDPPQGLDWEWLFDLMTSHRLDAFFSEFADKRNAAWEPAFLEKLKSRRYANKLFGDWRMGRIRETLKALTDAGVQTVVLKGWAKIYSLYGGDTSLRPSSDIDLLVRPQDVDKAEAVFEQTGWVGDLEGWQGYARQYLNGRRFINKKSAPNADAFSIGFHWGLFHIPTYDPQLVNVDNLFERADSLKVADVAVWALSAEDDFVYTCAHLGWHHRFEKLLFRYFELASILREAKSLNWDRVAARAIEWQCVLPLQHCVSELETLWGAGLIPPSEKTRLSSLRPSRREQFVNRWVLFFRHRIAFDHILNWLTFPRRDQRLVIMFKDIFPSPGYMQDRYGKAPGGFLFFLYLKRFFRAAQAFLFPNKTEKNLSKMKIPAVDKPY